MGFFDVIADAFRAARPSEPSPSPDDGDVEIRALERAASEGDDDARLRLALVQERRDGAAKAFDAWLKARLGAVNGTRRYSILGSRHLVPLLEAACAEPFARLYLVPDGVVAKLEDSSLGDDDAQGANGPLTLVCAVRDGDILAVGSGAAIVLRPYPERVWPGITWRDRVTPTPPPDVDAEGHVIPRPPRPKRAPEVVEDEARQRAVAWAKGDAADRTRVPVEVVSRWLLLRASPGGLDGP